MARLSYAERKRMSKSSFALPAHKTKSNPAGKGGYPIPDKAHARNALARVAQFGSSEEKAAVRAKVHKKYPSIGKTIMRHDHPMHQGVTHKGMPA